MDTYEALTRLCPEISAWMEEMPCPGGDECICPSAVDHYRRLAMEATR